MPVNTKTERAYTLKYVYLPVIKEALSTYSPLEMRMNRQPKAKTTSDGKGFVVDIEYARSAGRAAAEGGALPTASVRKDINATYTLKYYYKKIDFTGQAKLALGSKEASFDGTGTSRTMKSAVEDMTKDINRMNYGMGGGYLAMVSSASSEVLTLKTSSATNYALGWGGCFGTKFLFVGQHTDICDFTAGTSIAVEGANEAGGILSAVTSSTATQTTDPSYTEAAGDILMSYGGMSGTSELTFYEPYGLWAICNDLDIDDCLSYNGTYGVTTAGTLGGLTVGTYDWWKGNVVYNGTTSAKWATPQDLDLKSMQKAYHKSIAKYGPSAAPTAAYMTWDIYNEYGAALVDARRFTGSEMELDGGWKVLTFNGMPMIPDNDMAEGMMFFVHEPSLLVFDPYGGPEWIDEGDGIMKFDQSGPYDNYFAFLKLYRQVGTDCRDKHTILYNINQW